METGFTCMMRNACLANDYSDDILSLTYIFTSTQSVFCEWYPKNLIWNIYLIRKYKKKEKWNVVFIERHQKIESGESFTKGGDTEVTTDIQHDLNHSWAQKALKRFIAEISLPA
jgi:hypothetical protein